MYTSDPVHGIEDILVHYADIEIHILTHISESFGEGGEGAGHLIDLCKHDHYEHILQDGLGNVNNVDVVIGANICYLCKNTNGILTDYGNYCSHKSSSGMLNSYDVILS